ncbi:MAG: hypothetical protein HY053_05855 [Proteobacteria bacterium]|nr:hypothetical protein [Pseudomonadota bacterium]
MFKYLLLLSLLLLTTPAEAQEKPLSLVDRVLSLLGHENLPRLKVQPEAQMPPPSALAPPRIPPRRAEVELARRFLPVYDLDRGGEGKPQVLPFFASGELEERHSDILSIIVMVPDSDREAARAYAFARTAQDDASALHPEWYANNAFIFVPQFLTPEDIARRAAQWPDGGASLLRWAGGGWIYGADSVADNAADLNARGMTAYAALDFALLAIAKRELFPELQRVVIVGAGGGGDFVQRYAALGVAPDILSGDNISVRFVSANAWSYMYLDKTRAVPPEAGTLPEPGVEPVFAAPKEGSCASYNLFPYGFAGMPNYGRRQGENELRLRYVTRTVFYLSGAEATRPLPDASPQACALILQGRSLAERARLYFSSLQKLYGDDLARTQRFYSLPKVGEPAQAIWQHPCGLAALYGDGGCEAAGAVGNKLKTVE